MSFIVFHFLDSEGSWWLLDSGAATSVLSQSYEGMYRCQVQEDREEHWEDRSGRDSWGWG